MNLVKSWVPFVFAGFNVDPCDLNLSGLEAFSFDYIVKWPISLVFNRKVEIVSFFISCDVNIFSCQASLARQAFLITPLHGARFKTGKNAYAKK